jgi:leucyl aminopeptidase
MASKDIKGYSFIDVSVIPTSQWAGDMLIIPTPYSEEAESGGPGKQVGDMVLMETEEGQRQLRLSLGQESALDPESVRRAGGATARWLSAHNISFAAIQTDNLLKLGFEDSLSAFTQGMLLGAFRFNEHKSEGADSPNIEVNYLADDQAKARDIGHAVSRDMAIVDGVNLARAIAHQPPNIINPSTLAGRACALAESSDLICNVLGEKELAEMGAGSIRSVGLGSNTPSQMIILEYPGHGDAIGSSPVVLVGKAITFDTGGYSLKTKAAIVGMKYDKCGGAAVLGIMQAVAALGLSVPVVGIIAAAENMISADAYRPNDIITTLSGKTVEIISTDAEGRLVLCDSLTYAQRHYQPRVMIDLATLTSGIVTALGNVRAGLFSNNEVLVEALFNSGERTHERLWRMPLDGDYFELIRGDDSDLRNSTGLTTASPIVGGIFLKQFVSDDTPWAHIDIAGVAKAKVDLPYCPKGATGFGVRLLVDYLSGLA